MQKLFLLIFFSYQISVCAEAKEWTLIHIDNDKTSFYINLGDFLLENNKTRMWVMENFRTIQEVKHLKYLSTKSLVQFDCNLNIIRILAYSLYEDQFASGNSIYNRSEALKWDKISPHSVNKAYQDIACQEAIADKNQ